MSKSDSSFISYEARDGMKVNLDFTTVRKYLVSGHADMVSDSEIVLYMGMARARKLNPFTKDCYLIKFSKEEPAAIIVSIDYLRSQARAQEDCQGWKCGIVVAHESNVEQREGAILYPGDMLLGGWFRAQPKGWPDETYWAVPLGRYVKKTKDGNPTRFWLPECQPEQIAKVAESQGIRRTWPREFGHLYIEEEINTTEFQLPRAPLQPPQAISPEPPPPPALSTPISTKPSFKDLQQWIQAASHNEILSDDREVNQVIAHYKNLSTATEQAKIYYQLGVKRDHIRAALKEMENK
jgi:phage recombination protein Bet